MSQEKTQTTVIAAAVQAFLGVIPAASVAWPNKVFTPGAGIWAAVHYIPARPSSVTTGERGEDELLGILQIDISIPTNTGDKAQRAALDSLETFFTPGKSFSYGNQEVTFLTCARSNGRVSNSSYWMIPLSVSFRARYNRKPLN